MVLMAVLVFLKVVYHQVNICNKQKNYLVIVSGNANFDFGICCFGNNFWWILEQITCLFINLKALLHTNEANIWKYIWSSLIFFPFGWSWVITVWSGFFLDKTLPILLNKSSIENFIFCAVPFARGFYLYKNLIAFSVKRTNLYPKII